ncbi:MAG: acylphosphatase [Gemmatimonadetes bacterium]|nr:acylphosphatase [Gemmatimonadota bacterium]
MAGPADARGHPGDGGHDVGDGGTRAVRLEVRGHVQGVGFRWFVREKARRWGCQGWVRNHPDGTVLIVVRGESHQVGGLLEDVRRGPPGARVDAIHEHPAHDDDFPHPFEIRKDR